MPSKLCPWCHEKKKPLRQHQLEWTVYDDDFAQPVHIKMIHYCFFCGRRIDQETEE